MYNSETLQREGDTRDCLLPTVTTVAIQLQDQLEPFEPETSQIQPGNPRSRFKVLYNAFGTPGATGIPDGKSTIKG